MRGTRWLLMVLMGLVGTLSCSSRPAPPVNAAPRTRPNVPVNGIKKAGLEGSDQLGPLEMEAVLSGGSSPAWGAGAAAVAAPPT